MIVLAGAVLTTVVVAVVKRLGFEIAAAFLAGPGHPPLWHLSLSPTCR